MKDFWYTFGFFTFVGVVLAAFVRFVFFLAWYGYSTKFVATVAVFMVAGLILGIIAQKYKIVTRVIDKIWD